MSGSSDGRAGRAADEACSFGSASRNRVIAGAAEGLDALLLASLARKSGGAGHLHIARDSRRAELLKSLLSIFAPGLNVIVLPGWDSPPYDRMSPSMARGGARVAALQELATRDEEQRLLLIVTASALVQRIPEPQFFLQVIESLALGAECEADGLQLRLRYRGFSESALVQEQGEFSLRGLVLDFWPPSLQQPVRLEFAEGRIAGMRCFDPSTQQTTAEIDCIEFGRASEIPLDPSSIARFKSNQQERLGGILPSTIEQALDVPSKPFGLEPWLPLFHARLLSVSEWLPRATISFEEGADERIEDRLELVRESFETHRSLASAENALRPLPPEALYIQTQDWKALLARRATRITPNPSDK